MALLILAYLGGVLTLLSPCILPVLPFIFTRNRQSFWQGTFPLLLGMALTFTVVALLATAGGAWAIHANIYGRFIALLALGLLGLSLCWPSLSHKIMSPLVQLGDKLHNRLQNNLYLLTHPFLLSFLIGVATGLLWTPCAGPILGLVLTSTIAQGISPFLFLLLFIYALGATSSLALILYASKRLSKVIKQTSRAEVWLQRILGIAIVLCVFIIMLGLERKPLAEFTFNMTSKWEQILLHRYYPDPEIPGNSQEPHARGEICDAEKVALEQITSRSGRSIPFQWSGFQDLADLLKPENANASDSASTQPTDLPDLSGIEAWINTSPLTAAQLKGKVVLIDFWTYSCINCLRSLPYVRAWQKKYKDQGLVVIGVHTPEFAFEKNHSNVARAVEDLDIIYPVALDDNYTLWKELNNRYWPAHYFFDATGKLRHTHFGEGGYVQSEQVIQSLLAQRNGKMPTADMVKIHPHGKQAAPSNEQHSAETYLGYGFRDSPQFVSIGGVVKDDDQEYSIAKKLRVNDWGLVGHWHINKEYAALLRPNGRIVYRFYARDLHLVAGPSLKNQSIRFRVTLDGAPPGKDHGADVNAQGEGHITEYRLYQLIRQEGNIRPRLFEIEFLDPSVQAFSFTFG